MINTQRLASMDVTFVTPLHESTPVETLRSKVYFRWRPFFPQNLSSTIQRKKIPAPPVVVQGLRREF